MREDYIAQMPEAEDLTSMTREELNSLHDEIFSEDLPEDINNDEGTEENNI